MLNRARSTGVVDTGGKVTTGIKYTRVTGAKFTKFTVSLVDTGVNYTGGKFASVVVDTSGAP